MLYICSSRKIKLSINNTLKLSYLISGKLQNQYFHWPSVWSKSTFCMSFLRDKKNNIAPVSSQNYDAVIITKLLNMAKIEAQVNIKKTIHIDENSY